jgi:hypothetical protein
MGEVCLRVWSRGVGGSEHTQQGMSKGCLVLSLLLRYCQGHYQPATFTSVTCHCCCLDQAAYRIPVWGTVSRIALCGTINVVLPPPLRHCWGEGVGGPPAVLTSSSISCTLIQLAALPVGEVASSSSPSTRAPATTCRQHTVVRGVVSQTSHPLLAGSVRHRL